MEFNASNLTVVSTKPFQVGDLNGVELLASEKVVKRGQIETVNYRLSAFGTTAQVVNNFVKGQQVSVTGTVSVKWKQSTQGQYAGQWFPNYTLSIKGLQPLHANAEINTANDPIAVTQDPEAVGLVQGMQRDMDVPF